MNRSNFYISNLIMKSEL